MGPSMSGRDFLKVARDILTVTNQGEEHWRAVIGRAYYALMLECRDALFRWGFAMPPRDNVHTFVRLRFSFAAHADLKHIGKLLDALGRLRNQADYDLSFVIPFSSSARAQQAVTDVTVSIALLDTIDSDPVRRGAAVAAVRAAFP